MHWEWHLGVINFTGMVLRVWKCLHISLLDKWILIWSFPYLKERLGAPYAFLIESLGRPPKQLLVACGAQRRARMAESPPHPTQKLKAFLFISVHLHPACLLSLSLQSFWPFNVYLPSFQFPARYAICITLEKWKIFTWKWRTWWIPEPPQSWLGTVSSADSHVQYWKPTQRNLSSHTPGCDSCAQLEGTVTGRLRAGFALRTFIMMWEGDAGIQWIETRDSIEPPSECPGLVPAKAETIETAYACIQM